MKKLISTLAAVAVTSGTANAVPIVDGQTVISIVPELGERGVSFEPINPAQESAEAEFNNNLFFFDIVGEELDGLSGNIVHTGGIELAFGGDSLALTNFDIDLDDGLVRANVAGAAETTDVFSFTIPGGPGGSNDFGGNPVDNGVDSFDPIDTISVSLFYTQDTLSAFTAVFGSDLGLSTESQFATAVSNPVPTPVPAAALLFVPAIAGAFLRKRVKSPVGTKA